LAYPAGILGVYRERWARGLSLSQLLFWTGFGSYYTYTRAYIEELRGQDYSFAVLVAGAETAPLALSVVMGFLADYLGRRRLVLLGFGEAAAVAAMGLADLRFLPLLAALGAFFYSIAYSALLGALLAGVRGSGVAYSMIAAAGSLGWALGGLLGGYAFRHGPLAAYGLSSLMIALGYAAGYASVTAELEPERRPGVGEVVSASRRIMFVVVSVILGQAALNVFFSSASLKLKAEIGDPLVFGLVFSTITAILGALARPLAGMASDRLGEVRLLALTAAAYAALAYAVAVLRGLPLILAWLIPLYPFRDVAVSMSISSRLPRSLQATAAGIISFTTSASGALSLALAPAIRGLDITGVFTVCAALLAASIAVVAPLLRRPPGTVDPKP
jgi:hypothetical protein